MSANCFDALQEENLDTTSPAPAPVPKLLDAKRIKELITANATKLDMQTQLKLIKLCKSPAPVTTSCKLATPPDINAITIGQGIDELNSAFVNKSNSVQTSFPLMHYRGIDMELALLDSGATENFIDHATATQLRLGMKALLHKRAVYNVDGTPNRRGTISHAVDLLVAKGNKKLHQRFYVTDLGQDRFIFGYPWFREFNPDINWPNSMLKGPKIKMETLKHGTFQHACNFIKEKKKEDQDNDLIMKIQATTLADITPDMSDDDDDHIPWMGVTFLEEESGPVEINRTHNTVEMAHKYTKQHAKEEVTLPPEFKRHAALFSDEEAKKFPPSQPHDHKIELTPKAPDKFNCKLYPMSLADQAIEDEFLDENLEKGYIIPLDSPYSSSTFMVPKKDSKEKRYIIDYRPLNAVTKKDVTLLPNLAQCIEDLQGMELFSKFDIRWGYNNIHIREGDKWKGAFKTCRGLYKPKVMFFGMSNSPPTFQRFVNHMLEPFYKKYRQRHLKNYMDDCGIGTKLVDKELHEEMLHYLFDLLAAAGLHLKLSKSVFMKPQMDFLGVRISKKGATINPAKIAGISDWPEEIKTLKEARSFIGVTGYHCMFIPGFSQIATPIT